MMAFVIAGVVLAGFALLAIDDIRTRQVLVVRAQALTAIAVVGLGTLALVQGAWTTLVTAALGAAVIFVVQLTPYLAQRHGGRAWIGRADVRLAVPFGWTLGFFGLGYVLVGFAAASIAGLVTAGITRQRTIPFVPFLALGLAVGLIWAFAIVRSIA